MPRRIDSTSNPIIVRARSLRDSRRRRWTERAFLVEGPRFIGDFMAGGLTPEHLLLGDGLPTASPLRHAAHIEVADRALAEVSATEHSQGAVAIFPFPGIGLREKAPTVVLLLDRVQDPGNVGTLIRSAAACEADGVWLTPGAADPFNPKVIRAAAAAHAAIDIGVGPFEEVERLGLRLVVADGRPGSTPMDDVDWSVPSLLVLGNEGAGVSTELVERADVVVGIPMSSRVESLNVAVAGSVLLFEASRERRRTADRRRDAGAVPY